MDHTFRIATLDDAQAIGDLTRQAYAKWVPLIGREPAPMTVDYVDAVQRHRFDLLELDGWLAGLIETTPQGDDLLIVNVAVSPDFQKRGLAVALMRHAEALAEVAGHAATRLYTNRRFTENIALYARLGYRVEREEALNGGVAVHMVKPLAEAAALACLDAFTVAFNARDAAGMDAQLHFPHILLTGGQSVVWKTPGQLPEGWFQTLEASGWRRSVYHARTPILVSADKAHVLVDYSREGEGGHVLGRQQNLWILTREAGRWGIKVRSY